MFTSRSFFALFHSVRLLRKAQFEPRVKNVFHILQLWTIWLRVDAGTKKVYVHYFGNYHQPPARDLQSFCSVHILFNSRTDSLNQPSFGLNQSPT